MLSFWGGGAKWRGRYCRWFGTWNSVNPFFNGCVVGLNLGERCLTVTLELAPLENM